MPLRSAFGPPSVLNVLRSRLHQHDLEWPLYAILLGNGHVAVSYQWVAVELKEWFVIALIVPPVVEIPTMFAMTFQQANLVGISTPKAPYPALVLALVLGGRVDVSVFCQRSEKFIAVRRTSFGKAIHAPQL